MNILSWSFSPPYRRTGGSATVARARLRCSCSRDLPTQGAHVRLDCTEALSIVLDDEDEDLNMMVLVVAGAERRLESSADAGVPDCSGQASSASQYHPQSGPSAKHWIGVVRF